MKIFQKDNTIQNHQYFTIDTFFWAQPRCLDTLNDPFTFLSTKHIEFFKIDFLLVAL